MAVRYGLRVLALAAVALAGGWWYRDRMAAATLRGGMLGVTVAAAGAVGGMLLIAWAFEQDQKRFFGALAAGVLGRLALYGAVVVIVALRWPGTIDAVATAVALLTAYVVFQSLELRFVLRGLGKDQGARG